MLFALIVSVCCMDHFAAAQSKSKKSKKETLKNDYSDELPRIRPKEPRDALKSFKLRPGFRIDLVAAEPLIRDPVAIDFDEDGRMFVVEMPEYNQYANKKFKGHGVVKMLEDADQDGRFDKASVYVDKLDSPAAVACYDGGIFVGAVPDILFCKDTNGDGKADVRKRVFTGFARDKAGEAMLNSFRWGFDNRFHLSTNLAGGNVRRADQKDAKPLSVRGRGFIFDPRTYQFELTSGGGQHGMSMDDWGRKFVCSNSNPAQTLIYDDRYLARNPYLAAPAAAVNIVPTGKHTKLFRISRIEPWRALRTRLRSKGLVKGSDEGGKPAGFFTGATGVTIYRGDAWPGQFRGNLFVGDVANNLIFRAKLEPAGVSLTAGRADPGVEFLASSDIWFRPVQLANAPDGSLYVVDMYREMIEGAAFLPDVILKHMDVNSGVNRGRIYRIVPDDVKLRAQPKLSRATTAQLVRLLEHQNGWHRDTASRLLYQRQDRSAVADLKKLVAGSKLAIARVYGLYSLQGLNALDAELVLAALEDPNSRVREQALRLSERFAAESPGIRAKLCQMTGEPSLRERYQLAFSLGAFSGEARNRAVTDVLFREGANSWFRLALLSSLNDGAGDVFRLASGNRKFRKTNHGSSFLVQLASQIGAANRTNEIAAVLSRLNALPESEKVLAQSIVRGLVAKQKAGRRKQLLQAGGGKAQTILDELLANAQKTALDQKKKPAARAEAIRTLGLAEFEELQELFAKLVQLQQPQPVQAAALETLAQFNHAGVAPLILDVWPTLSPGLRARAAEALFSRTASIVAFLDAVEQEEVSRADVDPARIKLLQAHPEKNIRDRVSKLFAATGVTRRKDVVDAYQPALKQQGGAVRGKMVFKKICAACHKLEGVGKSVGADLTAVRDRGSAAVLLNILDPNREVKPKFLSYVLVTDGGKIITGMIVNETANSITLQRSDGTDETVLRIHVEELRSTGLSFMPEGLEKQIDVQAMADLLAYLNSIK